MLADERTSDEQVPEPSVVERVLTLLRLYMPHLEAELRRTLRKRAAGPRYRNNGSGPRRDRKASRPKDAGSTRKADPDPPRGPSVDRSAAECYAELEVPYGADLQVVRAAWRRLVREHHPDLQHTHRELGLERIQRVNRAYGELSRRLRSREWRS